MDTYYWDVLVTCHWDVIGCFIWDLFETSWRRIDEMSSLHPHETSSQHTNNTSGRRTTEMSWRRTTETSLGVSFESYLWRQWDVQRDVVTMSLRRLVAGWVEGRDISYQNFNTGENLYNFLLAQQDGQTAPVPKKNSYRYSFEKCIQNFLPSFSIDDVEKFDLYSNKNAKYLFYRFND